CASRRRDTRSKRYWSSDVCSSDLKLVGLPGFCPPEIILWLFRGLLGAVPICVLQLLLSMKIRSFSLPIAIALAGSTGGMLILNKDMGIVWPYSLMLLGMNSKIGRAHV